MYILGDLSLKVSAGIISLLDGLIFEYCFFYSFHSLCDLPAHLSIAPPHLPLGSADTLLKTYFPDGMSESLIAYLLHGVLKALEYLHRMGYVHRSVREKRNKGYKDNQMWILCIEIHVHMLLSGHSGVKASHILLSGEGRVYLSGLHSVYSMMREGKKMRAVFDMPHHSPALLPWLSPELLRQVGDY